MSEYGERNPICAEDPVWYNKTSGTMGAPKRIPYTQRMSDWYNRYTVANQKRLVYRETGDAIYRGRTPCIIRCGNNITKMPDGVSYGPISEAGVRLSPVNLADHSSALIPDSIFFEFIPLDDEDTKPVTIDKLDGTVSLTGEKPTELALRTAAERTAVVRAQ